MKTLTKNLLAGAVVGSLALAGAVIAAEEVQHRTIEINGLKDRDVTVRVDSNAGSETVIFTAAELMAMDSKVLDTKLANLDEDTRKTVMTALQGIRMSGDDEAHMELEKVFVMNKGDGQRVEFIGVDSSESSEGNVDIEVITDGRHKMIRKHIIHADGEHGVLKGHTDGIAKLIERGEFNQQELDKIQAALDAKR